jgi:hypothetical protein
MDLLLNHISEAQRTFDICAIAVRDDPRNHSLIKKEVLDDERFTEALMYAVKYETIIMDHIGEFATPEMCRLALKFDTNNIVAIPREMVTDLMLWFIIRKAPHNIRKIPPVRMTDEMVYYIMLNYPECDNLLNGRMDYAMYKDLVRLRSI